MEQSQLSLCLTCVFWVRWANSRFPFLPLHLDFSVRCLYPSSPPSIFREIVFLFFPRKFWNHAFSIFSLIKHVFGSLNPRSPAKTLNPPTAFFFFFVFGFVFYFFRCCGASRASDKRRSEKRLDTRRDQIRLRLSGSRSPFPRSEFRSSLPISVSLALHLICAVSGSFCEVCVSNLCLVAQKKNLLV